MWSNYSRAQAQQIASHWCGESRVIRVDHLLYLIALFADKRRGWDRFTWLRCIGGTQQGYLHMVVDFYAPGRPTAVKQVPKVWVAGACLPREAFVEERDTLEMLTTTADVLGGRPVRVLDSWDDDRSHYLAMEYYEGETLLQLVVRRAPWEQGTGEWQRVVRRLFGDLVTGVAAMHAAHVCHNDLSLHNVLLAPEYPAGDLRAKITGFSHAIEFHLPHTDIWMSELHTGNSQFQSPEVFADDPELDNRANDVWGLGVMLFMMLTGAALYTVADPEREGGVHLRLWLAERAVEVLEDWDPLHVVPDLALDVLKRVLVEQSRRMKMEELLAHPYVAPPPQDQVAHFDAATFFDTPFTGDAVSGGAAPVEPAAPGDASPVPHAHDDGGPPATAADDEPKGRFA